jgi:hypothetical protein
MSPKANKYRGVPSHPSHRDVLEFGEKRVFMASRPKIQPDPTFQRVLVNLGEELEHYSFFGVL